MSRRSQSKTYLQNKSLMQKFSYRSGSHVASLSLNRKTYSSTTPTNVLAAAHQQSYVKDAVALVPNNLTVKKLKIMPNHYASRSSNCSPRLNPHEE